MGSKSLIILGKNSDASIEEAGKMLDDIFETDERDISIKTEEDKITLTIEDWNCFIDLNSESFVAEEAQELAENFSQNPDEKELIASSSRRFEVVCDDDPEMDYFNDYLTVIQELGSFKEAKIWEQAQQAFI